MSDWTSLEETAVCVIGAAGEVIAEAKVLSEPEAIAAYAKRRAPRAVKVGLETGSLSPWLHRGLCAAGLPALCIDARRVAAYAQADPVKTDRKDARLIALAMRAGLYRVAHVKSEASLRDRQLLASRQMVLRQARQLQGKVRVTVRLSRGRAIPGSSSRSNRGPTGGLVTCFAMRYRRLHGGSRRGFWRRSDAGRG